MHNVHKYFLSTTISIFFTISACEQVLAMATRPETKTNDKINTNTLIEKPVKKELMQSSQILKFCPPTEKLTKKGDIWATSDNKWKNFTHSSATKVLNFLGAQWVGIKVGKIICLYQTNEAVAFPLAVEQTSSQLIIEPTKFGWSSLVNNRKFCKSTNIADCPYAIEAPKDNTDIYKQIEYNPEAATE